MHSKKERVDRRVLYTKMFLRESLLELMKKKRIHEITMTELCEHADINPKTFYTHYKNVEDLLASIEDDFCSKIQESIHMYASPHSVRDILAAEYRVFEANMDICTAFFAEHNFPRFSQKLSALIHDTCIQLWKSAGISDDRGTLELLFAFYAHSGLTVVREWVLNTPKEDTEQLAALIEQAGMLGLNSFVQP